ncbi:hypothetical protein MSAN_00139400 [Mycena sanguinolenta]|uniref:DUF6534 domain-containing protein n=1 Tax=Mycena sanguinolenta TaxID=230812 RepID=A0A8H6ZGX0_9AGAR|nr:hypothetical protein MSAN_00139400 [Mycena sanguinolenta]
MPSLSIPGVPDGTLFSILDLATYADLFLQGVLCAQCVHYLGLNERDSISMKLFVAGLAFLTTLKSVHVLAQEWFQDSTLFGTLEDLNNYGLAKWLSEVTIVFGAIIVFYVQLFFCHRLWALSHNVYIVVITVTLFVVALVAAIVATRFYFNISLTADWYLAHLGLTMGGDLLQTGSIVFYLLRHSKNAIAVGPTASMLNSLLRVTIQAIRGSKCPTLSETITHASLDSVISAIPSIMLPKVYGITAMWTLNTRQGIRAAAVSATPTPRSHEFETTTLDARLEWNAADVHSARESDEIRPSTGQGNGQKTLQ